MIEMTTTETYPQAFTYENGDKLDLNSAKGLAGIGPSTAVGEYHRDATSTVVMTGTFQAQMDADMNTDLTVVGDGTWSDLYTVDMTCTGSSEICETISHPPDQPASGTFTMPPQLYLTPAGDYIFQTSETLVYERQ